MVFRERSPECNVEGTLEELRLEAGRTGGRPLHPDRREMREAWTRREGGRCKAQLFQVAEVGEGWTGWESQVEADQGPGQGPQNKSGSRSCSLACHMP